MLYFWISSTGVLCTMVWTLQKVGPNIGWSCCLTWKWCWCGHCKNCESVYILEIFYLVIWFNLVTVHPLFVTKCWQILLFVNFGACCAIPSALFFASSLVGATLRDWIVEKIVLKISSTSLLQKFGKAKTCFKRSLMLIWVGFYQIPIS